ncbi:hypothetical protein J7L60_01350, partial [Candidatus Bathyarchaeota archaeon]|nr:hypothetical protein [Candidatus Bathyarchaeota archaeon]
GGRGYGHTRYDTVDKVELRYMCEAAANYSRLILRVANVDEWPARHRTEEEVREVIKAQGYLETIALAEKVREYVSKWEDLHPDTKAWLERQGSW